MAELLATRDDIAGIRIRPVTASVGLILASVIIFLLNTRHGIGILPDSVAYMRIGVARHFAPFYTWLLQGIAALGVDIVVGAKWLGLGLVCLNTFLAWRLIFDATGSLRHAVGGTALIILSPVFVRLHSVAMSEPLFVTLLLVSLFTFVQGLKDRRIAWFLATGAVLGANMLTRFAAAPAIGAICLTRLMHADRPLLRRFLDCLAIGVVAVAIFAVWVAASELRTGTSTGRVMEFRGDPDTAVWLSGLDALSILLLPSPVPAAIRMTFFVFVAGACTWIAIRLARRWLSSRSRDELEPWMAVVAACGLFALSYVGFLVLTVFVQAYNVPLDGRAYLPLYVAAVIAVAISTARLHLPRQLSVTMTAIAVIILASHVARTAMLTSKSFANGIGYADRDWANSAILRAVSQLPQGGRIFSNAPDVITFRLNRPAEYIPNWVDHLTGSALPLAPQVAALREGLTMANSYLVIVERVDWRFYQVPEKQLIEELPVTKIIEESDGRIYQLRQGG